MTTLRYLASFALAIIVGCTVGETFEDDEEDDSGMDLESALLVRSRDHLVVCLQIDPALAANTNQYVTQLRTDLATLQARHPDWHVGGLGQNTFEIVVGCPGDGVLPQLIDDKGTGGAVIGPGLRSAPTQFRTHVHVLGDVAANVLADRPFGRAIAELAAVDDHRVAEVSTALVIRASALGTDAFRNDALAQGLGLRVLH
jgi:hypothetical protein